MRFFIHRLTRQNSVPRSLICGGATTVLGIIACAQDPALAQELTPNSQTVSVKVSAQVVGRTPTRIGYVLGENRPGSNVSSWLRYDEINDARFWWPATAWAVRATPWTGENSLTNFEAARARFRQNPENELDWKMFRSNVATSFGGRPTGTLGDSFMLSELHKIGASPLIVVSHSRQEYPFDTAAKTPDWQGRWNYWRGVYANVFYLARTYGVERFQLFNEPDGRESGDLTQSDFLRRLQFGSDAVQAAINDVNRIDGKKMRAQVSAPVSAGMMVFAARTGRPDTRDLETGWGELVTRAQNADFLGRSTDNRGLFQAYAFQNYTRNPGSISNRLPGLMETITKANGGTPLPMIASEMNVSTAADFSKTDATLDTPKYYAAFGAVAAAYSNAGLEESYIFRHTQTNNFTGGAIKKNGTHFLNNSDPLKSITGSTKSAEVARLWIRGFKGGKTRFAVPQLPADLYTLAARDEQSGAYSLLISNLGESRVISIDLQAWKLPADALVTTEEVSETHHGDLKSVSYLAQNGQISLPMSANSVDLLSLRPNLRRAPLVSTVRDTQGDWRVSRPKLSRQRAIGEQFLLALKASTDNPAQKIRIYGGTAELSQAELLGQIVPGTIKQGFIVDVTRYVAANIPGAPLFFRIVGEDSRTDSIRVSDVKLESFVSANQK